MKALSLKQPWAELVVSGKKTIELRTWNTKFRGEFMIHASQAPDKEAMRFFGFKSLPTGCIVGKATIDDVKVYTSASDFHEDADKHLAGPGWFDEKTKGFVLSKVTRLKEKNLKGKLGFFDV